MKCLIILTIIILSLFLVVDAEKCERRVCRKKLYSGVCFIKRLRIEPSYCTHVIIHCAQVTEQQELYFKIHRTSTEIQQIVDLKKENRDLKVILAVQNENFTHFLNMYTTENLKSKFITNIIKYVRANNIDGVKIDVQTAKGGDKQKFTQLFKDLLAAFTAEAARSKKQRLLLTVGVPSDKEFLDKYYDLPAIVGYVDMIDLATYDFGTGDTNYINPKHHSPLYSEDPHSTKTIDYMARYVAGIVGKKDKLNIGLSLMTVAYLGNSRTGHYYRRLLTFAYAETCEVSYYYDTKYYKIEPDKGRMVDWHYDRTNGFFLNRYFYDDPETIREKVKYIKANHYGGVLLHSIQNDDQMAKCKRGTFPLSKTVYEECR